MSFNDKTGTYKLLSKGTETLNQVIIKYNNLDYQAVINYAMDMFQRIKQAYKDGKIHGAIKGKVKNKIK